MLLGVSPNKLAVPLGGLCPWVLSHPTLQVHCHLASVGHHHCLLRGIEEACDIE